MKTTVKIINLSSKKLTNAELSLLSKNLKFVPTPRSPNLMDMEIDIKEFVRKLQLKEIFHNKPSVDISIVKPPSDFLPLIDNVKNPLLKNVCQNLNNTAENLNNLLPEEKVYRNITSSENKALEELKRDDSIIIKEADKGGSVIIMNKTYYIQKIEAMLRNKKVYKLQNQNIDNLNAAKVKQFANKYKAILTNDERTYISNFDYKTANYYGLPKVHKCSSIKELVKDSKNTCINIEDPPDLKFRGITSGIDCPTSHLSDLINKLLKPFVSVVVKTHVRDTTDFINKLNRCEEDDLDDILLTTVDIVDMYPSINKKLGIKAVEYFLNEYPDILNQNFPNRSFTTNFIIDALNIILDNNLVQFNGKYYTQILGTVTGTVVAPTYATLAIAYLEVTLEVKINELYTPSQSEYIIGNLRRYLDDCFIPWKKSFGDVGDFINILNSLDSGIKFTQETNNLCIPFLNVLIYKGDRELKCDVYYKETDNREYLHFNSSHPHHTKSNIPFTLARTICTIVDDREICAKRLTELKFTLKNCGYPYNLIENACDKAYELDQSSLRQLKEKPDDDTIVFVTTFNPQNPNVTNIINNSFNFLLTDSNMKKVFSKSKLLKSYKEPPNLGDLLTRSCLTNIRPLPGVNKCGSTLCKVCENIIPTDTYYFHEVDQNFFITSSLNCSVKNCVYVLTCENCSDYYIGKTVDLRRRMSKHRRAIEDEYQRELKVSIHIATCCDKPRYSVLPFYQVKRKGAIALAATEEFYIRKFKPVLNKKV